MTELTMEQAVQERAVLVGLNADCFKQEQTADDESLRELEELLQTAGGICTGKVLQNRHTPDPHSFIGEGKAMEVRQLVEATASTMVVFDNELSPGNIRALEELIGVTVLDRSALILDIFAQRAKTKEGRLQVELAQYKYLLPRLSGMGASLSRQGGGIGTRGPGETKLESDRRSAPVAPAKPSWNPTAVTSGSGSTGWKGSWNRCARCARCSGSGG